MSGVIELSINTWFDTFEPIKNHLDDRASFKGTMFETYGEELEFIKNTPYNKVWTFIESEDGDTIIIDGYHISNRIGFFITKEPRLDINLSYEIT